MNAPHEESERLVRLLALVAREDEHLLAVRWRLLGDDCDVSESRAQRLLSDRSIRLARSCANMIEADFLLHRGRFHSGLATRASAILSTG